MSWETVVFNVNPISCAQCRLYQQFHRREERCVLPLCAAPSCTVTSSGISFGVYDSIRNRPADAVGTISVTCSGAAGGTVKYSIALSPGTGTVHSRRLAAANGFLHYNLYVDSDRSTVWGDGTGGTSVISDAYVLGANATTRTYPVFSRIPGHQKDATARPYTDTILINLAY